MDSVRIDKWLWAARFFKTRGAATDAVGGGHVRVGGMRVKPSREVKEGDVVKRLMWSGLLAGLGAISSIVAQRAAAVVWRRIFAEEPPE